MIERQAVIAKDGTSKILASKRATDATGGKLVYLFT